MVVHKADLHDPSLATRDLDYWLSRPLSERIEAVEILRAEMYGDSERLQRVARVVQRPRH